MVTNAANDRVQQNLEGVCNDAESYCGNLSFHFNITNNQNKY